MTLTADCPAGMRVLNGGVDNSGPQYLEVHVSEPITGGTGWAVRVTNVVFSSTFEVRATARALCTTYPGA